MYFQTEHKINKNDKNNNENEYVKINGNKIKNTDNKLRTDAQPTPQCFASSTRTVQHHKQYCVKL